MRNPRMSPTTNTQAMTEPNRHQLITMATPPTTPISAVRANRTASQQTVNQRTRHASHDQLENIKTYFVLQICKWCIG